MTDGIEPPRAAWKARGVVLAAFAGLFVLALFFGQKRWLPLEAEASSGGLRMRISRSSRDLAPGHADKTSVTFTNLRDEPIIVLTRFCRLKCEGRDAVCIPHPGPAPLPWDEARSLAPGESVTVAYTGVTDRHASWRLKPGSYALSAVLSVSEEKVKAGTWPDDWPHEGGKPPGRIWKGKIRAGPVGIVVRKRKK
ncbi:MAG: hypothetical protein ACYTGB_08615 [Planctomycetota bacterium]